MTLGGLFANLGFRDGYFLYQLCLPCIFELCFANISGAILFIIVAIVHAHPVSCPPAAQKDLEITFNYLTGVKYEENVIQSLHGLYMPVTDCHIECIISLDKLSIF